MLQRIGKYEVLETLAGGEEGTVKVTDFGIARAMEASTMSRTGVMGTPFYMSPEQWAGGRVDGRADIYSLGIVLYELLTGSPPFQGEGMGDVYRQHVEEPIPRFSPELGVPPWLESVVYHCLEKEREDRFGTAAEVIEALEGELSVRVVTALLPRRIPSRVTATTIAGAGIFLALSLVVLALGGEWWRKFHPLGVTGPDSGGGSDSGGLWCGCLGEEKTKAYRFLDRGRAQLWCRSPGGGSADPAEPNAYGTYRRGTAAGGWA